MGINRGADVDSKDNDDWTPLFYAARENAVKVAELLLKHNASLNATNSLVGRTPLHIAAAKDSLEVAELLLKKGADIDSKDDNDQTPLHYAAGADSVKVAELLIAEGANLNVIALNADDTIDVENFTPLELSKIYGSKMVQGLLKRAGAQ